MGYHPLFVDLFKIKATTGVPRGDYKSEIIGITPDDKQDSYAVVIGITPADPVSYHVTAWLGPLNIYVDGVDVVAAGDVDKKETSYDVTARLTPLEDYTDYVDVEASENHPLEGSYDVVADVQAMNEYTDYIDVAAVIMPPLTGSYDVVAYLEEKKEYIDYVSVVAQVIQPSDAYDVMAEIGNLLADLEEEIDANRVQAVIKTNVNRSPAALRRYRDTLTTESVFIAGRLDQQDIHKANNIFSNKKQGTLITDIEQMKEMDRSSDVNTLDTTSYVVSDREAEKHNRTEHNFLGCRETSKSTDTSREGEAVRIDDRDTYLADASLSMRNKDKDIVNSDVHDVERKRKKEISTEERILSDLAAIPVDIIRPIYSDRIDTKGQIVIDNALISEREDAHHLFKSEAYQEVSRGEEVLLEKEQELSSSRSSVHDSLKKQAPVAGELAKEKEVIVGQSIHADREMYYRAEKSLDLAAVRDVINDVEGIVVQNGSRKKEEEISLNDQVTASTDKTITVISDYRDEASRVDDKGVSIESQSLTSDRKDDHSIKVIHSDLLTRNDAKDISTETDGRADKKARPVEVDRPTKAERYISYTIQSDASTGAERMERGIVKVIDHTTAIREEFRELKQTESIKTTRSSDGTIERTERLSAERLPTDVQLSHDVTISSERQDALHDVLVSQPQYGGRDKVVDSESDDIIGASGQRVFSSLKDVPVQSARTEEYTSESTNSIKSRRTMTEEISSEVAPAAHRNKNKSIMSDERFAADKVKDKDIVTETPETSIKKAKPLDVGRVSVADRLNEHNIEGEEHPYAVRNEESKVYISETGNALRENEEGATTTARVQATRDEQSITEVETDNKAHKSAIELDASRDRHILADRESEELSLDTGDRVMADRKEQDRYIDVHDWLKGTLKEDYKYIDINDMIYGERDNLQLTEKEGTVLYERIKDKLSELHAADLAVRKGINEVIKESGSSGQAKEEEDEEEEKLIWLVLGKPTWMHRWNTLKYR